MRPSRNSKFAAHVTIAVFATFWIGWWLAQTASSQESSPALSVKGTEDILLRDFRPIPKLQVAANPREFALYPVVDVHNHFFIRFRHDAESLKSFLQVMDRNRIAVCVSLDATLGDRESEHLQYLWKDHADRFVIFCNIDFRGKAAEEDWANWSVNQPGFPTMIAESIRQAKQRGISGLKVFKQLGLGYKNPDGSFIAIDDERFDPIWKVCGELKLPVLIHTADPSAFFDPISPTNERIEELQRHPEWAFPSPPFPSRESLHAARNRVIARHPNTIFIAAHLGNDGENLDQTQAWLEQYPNLYVEFASRISELGRQPRRARAFLEKFADRILFGTDGPWSETRLRLYWRFLETEDEYFPYSEKDPPPQGIWNIDGVGLTHPTLEKIYSKNAERIIPGVAERIARWRLLSTTIRERSPVVGLENVFSVGDRLFSGSQPATAEAFETLKALGIQTIISVDGLAPDLNGARVQGMDYIHIPCGYDGISIESQRQLAAAMIRNPGRIYIHCHHGKHRGPAAAAIAGLSAKILDSDAAIGLMKRAGTSDKYQGLWNSVNGFNPIDVEKLDSIQLTPSAKGQSLSAIMATLDRNWERLQSMHRKGLSATLEETKSFAGYATLVREGLMESHRVLIESKSEKDSMSDMMKEAIQNASALESEIELRRFDSIGSTLKKIESQCQSCHDRFRN